jgi:hypothetical protein
LLCAELNNKNNGTVRYYFDTSGNLKRLEFPDPTAEDSAVGSIIEVTELKTPADDSYFSVKGFIKTPIADMEKLLSAFGQ